MNELTSGSSLRTSVDHSNSAIDAENGINQANTLPDNLPLNDDDESLETSTYAINAFRLTKKGVFFIDKDRNGNDKSIWICSPLNVIALTRDADSNKWGRLVEWTDQASIMHRLVIDMELLAGDGNEVRRELQRQGLLMSSNKNARDRLLDYLQWSIPDKTLLCVNRTGWHGSTYVMPNQSFDVIGNNQAIYQNSHGLESHYSQSGTRIDWTNHVSMPAKGNSRLILSISMAFSGALINLANVESGGIHLYGSSSCGKSTALKMASSVCGKPTQFMRQWLATGNSLEGIAGLHNDGLLPLDELGQSEPRTFANSIYTLANGQGKTRANSFGATRPANKWSVMILSTGEITTESHMNQAGQRLKAGQVNRLVNVEADADTNMGIFENIHDAANPSEFSKTLTNAAEKYYGVVGVAWVEYLSKNKIHCTQLVSDYMQQFSQQFVPKDAQGQVVRVSRRFALIAAAGEMATAQGFTGWQQGEAMAGVAKCFDNWLLNFGGCGNQEDRAILSHVRSFMEANGSSRFENLDTDRERINNRVGLIKIGRNGERLYLVYPEQFRAVICKGFDYKQVVNVLLLHGWLKPSERNDGLSKQHIAGQTKQERMYALTDKMFAEYDTSDSPSF